MNTSRVMCVLLMPVLAMSFMIMIFGFGCAETTPGNAPAAFIDVIPAETSAVTTSPPTRPEPALPSTEAPRNALQGQTQKAKPGRVIAKVLERGSLYDYFLTHGISFSLSNRWPVYSQDSQQLKFKRFGENGRDVSITVSVIESTLSPRDYLVSLYDRPMAEWVTVTNYSGIEMQYHGYDAGMYGAENYVFSHNGRLVRISYFSRGFGGSNRSDFRALMNSIKTQKE